MKPGELRLRVWRNSSFVLFCAALDAILSRKQRTIQQLVSDVFAGKSENGSHRKEVVRK